ncbi:MAG: hypothetical protein ACREPM_21375 [Gemmatimonadaceae bacterium]
MRIRAVTDSRSVGRAAKLRRSLRQLGVLAIVALPCACSHREAHDVLPFARRFDEVFRPIGATPLRGDDSTAFAFAGLVAGNRLFTVDPERGELRSYRRDNGSLISIPGAVGDGFGEFRHPIAVAQLADRGFVVYDDKRDILSVRDSLGNVRAETRIPHGLFGGVVALPDQRHIILSGAFTNLGDGSGEHDLHELDFGGKRTAAYGQPRRPRSEWEKKFNAEFAAILGGETLVSGTMNSSSLRLHNLSNAAERWIDIAPGWQHLDWPSDGVLRRGTTRQTVADRIRNWSHKSRLMNGVFPLSGGRLVVRYQAYSPMGSRLFYYVVADTIGRTLAITHPSYANILESRADTLFWVSTGRGVPQAFGVAFADSDVVRNRERR